MKILIATRCRNIVGGVETYLQALIPALLARGHRVGMLFDYTPKSDLTIDPPGVELPVWYVETLRQNPIEWNRLTSWRPDVVYAHDVASTDIVRVLQENYPSVVYVHSYWGTCNTGSKCHSFPTIQVCQRTFGPMCLLLHYPRRCGGLNPLVAWNLYQEARDRNALLLRYKAVLVASRHMHSEIERHGVDSQKLHLVRLPLTHARQPASLISKTPNGRLLSLGRLAPLKGFDFLISAVPLAETMLGRRLTLTIAGDGPELGKLRRLVCRHGVAAEFVDWVDGAKKLELLRQADLLVVPSLWPEPFGLVGIEAASVGLPAAGFPVGGIPDWLIPGQTGELAPAGPPTANGLANAIVRALANTDYYNHLRCGALEFSRRFSIEAHVSELEPILYDSVSSLDREHASILPSVK